MSRGCFVVAGPRSRDVLAKLVDAPLDNAAFPWLTGQVAEVGLATDVYLLRVNFVGALGWELHFPIEYAHHLFDAMFAAGAEFGIGMAGMRAMESLRLEKSYRMWGSDLTPDYTPYEAGLDRFVRLSKGPFIGKEALEKQLKAGVPHRFITFEVHGVTDADPLGNEPLFDRKGSIIGRATAGYYGHALQQELGSGLRQAGICRGRRRHRDRDTWASASAPRFSSIRRMIRRTRICGLRRRDMSRQSFSGLSLIWRGLSQHRGWQKQWRKPEPKARYDAVIVGGGGHGLGRRLLSGQGTWLDEYRRSGKGLDRRRQHRAQYHHHPLELLVQ